MSSTPVRPGRHGQQDQQRIEERLELRDQNQIDQHDREDQPKAEAAKRDPHALHHAAQSHADVLGQFASRATILSIAVGTLPQILAARRDINVHDAAQLVMVHFGGRLNVADAADGVEAGRLRSALASAAGSRCRSPRFFTSLSGYWTVSR